MDIIAVSICAGNVSCRLLYFLYGLLYSNLAELTGLMAILTCAISSELFKQFHYGNSNFQINTCGVLIFPTSGLRAGRCPNYKDLQLGSKSSQVLVHLPVDPPHSVLLLIGQAQVCPQQHPRQT